MITKCANPDCRARLRCLDHGRLFVANHPALEFPPDLQTSATEYFWLCDACSQDSELEIYIPRLDVFLGSQVVGAIEVFERGYA